MTRTFTGIQKDKLIIALSLSEIVAAINLAMRVRKLSLILDHTDKHSPKLLVEMPGIPAQVIMQYDYRKRCCYQIPPSNHELFFAVNDIKDRLDKFDAKLALGGNRSHTGARRCVLQVTVEGASQVGVTLMEAVRGQRTVDTSFQLPDGTTP